jgi:3-polyprenyl-4-hydroxybenzoate decarboxylase
LSKQSSASIKESKVNQLKSIIHRNNDIYALNSVTSRALELVIPVEMKNIVSDIENELSRFLILRSGDDDEYL